jgi:Ca2+-binding RTX toxin-like protein
MTNNNHCNTIECLESRRFLSATLAKDGTLVVKGGDHADNVNVYVSAAKTLTVQESGGKETDFVLSQVKRIVVRGGDGADYLNIDDSVSIGAMLFGEEGNDILVGGNGDDRLFGGPGDDHLAGGLGDDKLVGAAGADRLLGNEGDDTIGGGGGRDQIHSGAGKDVLGKGDKDLDVKTTSRNR